MIRLYASDETDFTHNRYLLKDVLSCEINEIENGAFDLTLEYPINHDIQEEAIIKAPTPRGEQLFVIESITKTLRGYKAYAIDYISYKLKKNFLIDVRPTDLNCQDSLNYMFNNLVNPVPFTATSDIKGISTGYYIRKNGLEALIGADNSILNRFGGYLKRDGMNIHIADKPVDNGYEIRMGKNLLGVEQQINISDVVTRLYPTAVLEDNTVTHLPEQYVDSQYLTNYADVKIQEYRIELTEDEKKLPLQNIHDIMRQKTKLEFDKGIDLPNINYKINFVNLAKMPRLKVNANTGMAINTHDELSTETHAELSLRVHGITFGDSTDILEKMNQLDISHMVYVYVPKLDIYVKARVIKYVYDAVGKKFKSIELGDYKSIERYQANNIVLNMDRNLKLKANQSSIETPTHVLTENGFELKDNSGGLLMNKYGSVNNDNFSSRDNVEAGYPLWIPFEIDDDVTRIKRVSLWWKNFPYRASAKSAGGGGAVVKSTGGGGGVVKSTGDGGGGVKTTASGGGSTSGASSRETSEYDAPPNFSTGYQVVDTEVPTKHFHVVSSSAMSHRHNMAHTHSTPNHEHNLILPDHTHEIDIPDHSHEITLEDHNHDLVFGIVETPITDDTITIFIDGTERATVNERTGKIDITEWITIVGDHEIELRSTTQKLIHANIALKTYIKG